MKFFSENFLLRNISQSIETFAVLSLAFGLLTSCSSAKKERLEQREKLANSSGMYCDFVNGEKYTDVEVVMNLEMAKKCDSAKQFSISQYRSPADVVGMMYCCSLNGTLNKKQELSKSPPPTRPSSPGVAPSSPSKPNDTSDEIILTE